MRATEWHCVPFKEKTRKIREKKGGGWRDKTKRNKPKKEIKVKLNNSTIELYAYLKNIDPTFIRNDWL